jgi:dihydroorotase
MTIDENASTSQVFDLLLQGGHVIDPANSIDKVMDVAIRDGKIAQVAADIPAASAIQVVDVAGMVVTPGILDIHTHVYTFRPENKNYVEGVNADAHLFAAGVTTTVDAGTAGWKHFLDFKENIIDQSKVRILAYINIARAGMVNSESEQNPLELQPDMAAAVAKAYPDLIVGIKTAHYWTHKPWDEIHQPWSSVDRAVEAAELCGKHVMVDFWPRPPERSYPDLILKKLRPGDIHTHVFAQQFPILNEACKVNDFMWQARERGVRFDLGHGAGSFWFRNAVPAFQDGFVPDTISTDLHMGNISGSVISMLNTMSKFYSMGMPLHELIYRSTSLPAQNIGHPELGTLTPGSDADVAVFKSLEGSFGFIDCGRARMQGSRKLECMLTLRAGTVVYDPTGVSMPEWEHAPAAYWVLPDLQA